MKLRQINKPGRIGLGKDTVGFRPDSKEELHK